MTAADGESGGSEADPARRERTDLRAYYEREAELGTRTQLRRRRIELRDSYIDLLEAEHRRSVIDFGSGPGLDGDGFVSAGLRYLGIDLAVGNARRARGRNLNVVPGSIDAPPVRAGSFSAGWSMSTLMHLPFELAATAVAAMSSCLESGAPLQIGIWGGPQRTEVEYSTIDGHRRPFHLRPLDLNEQLLADSGSVESIEIWDVGPDDWQYQVFRTRVRA